MTWDAYDLGVLAATRGDLAAARGHLRRAGDDPRALLLLGQLAADGPEARDSYRRAAELGSADAAYNLGALHAGDRLGEPDLATALDWYRRAARLGDAAAHRMAGVMYATGQGTPVEPRRAEEHLRRAAAAGETAAYRDLGTLLARDPVESAHWFLHAAARAELAALVPALRAETSTRARCVLGVALAFFLDDVPGGTALLAGAADDGDPVARRSLGSLVQSTDPARAAHLYRLAAEAGDGIAAFNVGLLAEEPAEAIRWLRSAAEQGITPAYAHLANRLSALDEDEEALRWYVRGATAGEKGCRFAAACWYRDGFGGPVDLVQALRWYLALLDVGSGDGIHEAHLIVPRMSAEEIHEAGRLSGRRLEADEFVRRRSTTL
ncbi:tetratricopeptide repeat protein [Cryptosporangium japonicum]|uniref:Sel1 repeat family protein n=1 Tax=Cryptosporangium japonicum TaxID=80872 RepID=A0ABN0TGS1_9ACTN